MVSYSMTTPSCATSSTVVLYLTKCPMCEFVLLAPAVDHGKVRFFLLYRNGKLRHGKWFANCAGNFLCVCAFLGRAISIDLRKSQVFN